MATLRIARAPGGVGVRVSAGDGASPPVDGDVLPPADDEGPFAALGAPVVGPSDRLLLAGSDGAWARAEERLGEALGAALSQAIPTSPGPTPWSHLQLLRGRAEGLGRPLVLLVNADPELAELPWELVSLGDGPHELASGGVVVRWTPATTASASAPRGTPGTVAVWTPSGGGGDEDPVVTQLAADVRASFAAAHLREVGLDEHPAVVWIIAHGQRGEDHVEVALDGEGTSLGAGAVSARLAGALAGASLAVVGVCHGGIGPARRDALVRRIVDAGTPVVIAPPHAVPPELLVHLARGAAPAFARGEPLHRVIALGRREVRAWAFPHRTARWTQVVAHAASAAALDEVVRPAGWVPAGFPPPDVGAARWFVAAHRDAVRRADGYVGVEHLLRGLLASGIDGMGPASAALVRTAPRALAVYDGVVAGLLPQRAPEGDPEPTPRVRGFAAGLPAGFGVEDLAARLVGSGGDAERPWIGAPTAGATEGTETLDSRALRATDGPARVLEVVGGPEDGRRLVPAEGDVIGRAGGGAAIQLYVDTVLTDRALSRTHVTWKAGRPVGKGVSVIGGSDGPLRVGEIVVVTPGTRWRGIDRG